MEIPFPGPPGATTAPRTGRSVSLTDDGAAMIAAGMEPQPLSKRSIHLLENGGENQRVTETEKSDVEFHEGVTKVSCHFLYRCILFIKI